ncbi:MAG: efflux RND transporter permease subunit [Oleibacter sp.]|nr:efflux RND transporter permease subunit [Thalassolituus sp.]
MQSTIRWFAHNPVAANLMMFFILIWGMFSLPETRKELIPNVSLERINIQSKLPGASVDTVERNVCRPIENRIYDIQGTLDLTSMSYEGYCTITVDIDDGYSTKVVVDEIRSRLSDSDILPAEATPPEIIELSIRSRVAKLIISGKVNYTLLTDTAHQFRNDLLDFDSISVVTVEDTTKPEIRIGIPSFILEQYNLNYVTVAAKIREQTGMLPGGILESQAGDILIVGGADRASTAEYEQIVIASDGDGGEVLLGDIATISDTRYLSETNAEFDESSAISVDVYRVGNQNITDISRDMRSFVDKVVLPEGVNLYIWQDESKDFQGRVDLLLKNAVSGLALLFVVLLLFLSARLSFWVSLGIPVSFLGALAVLPIFDVSINFISLFAFILVLGIVVDDAVVVGESIHLQNEQGKFGTQASIQGTLEVAKPIIFAVATTIIAFLPLVSLPGPEGKLMRPIPIVVIATLIFSLIESIYILPSHLANMTYHAQPKESWLTRLQGRFSSAMERLVQRFYIPLLDQCIRYRTAFVAGFTVMFLIVTLLLAQGWFRVSLFAAIESDVVIADVSFTEGTPRETTQKAILQLEAAADEINKEYKANGVTAIEHIYSVIGYQNSATNLRLEKNLDHTARVVLELASPETRTFSGQEVLALWRNKTGVITDSLNLTFSSSKNPTNPDIEIVFSGDDLETLYRLSDELAEHLTSYEGIFDIRTSHEEQSKQAEISLRDNASSLGLNIENVVSQVNRAYQGTVVQKLQTNTEEVDVWLGLPDDELESSWHLENLPIEYAPGVYVPLNTIAEIKYSPSKTHIRRYEGERTVSVKAFVNADMNSSERINAELSNGYLDELVAKTPGINWDQGGYQRSVRYFLDVLTKYYIFAILAMYLLMAVLFSSYKQPLLVLYAVPFGLLGSVFGHVLLGLDLTLWSFVGMVAVSGVVVNDNLVLLDYMNSQVAKGRSPVLAVIDAGRVRFRPIILTSLTTFAGLTPLISETSVQAQFLIPMAVSLGFGVIFATLISLLLVPAMALIFIDIENYFMPSKSDPSKQHDTDSIENAYHQGFESGRLGISKDHNPYTEEVLNSSWEAGWGDGQQSDKDSDEI